MRTKIYNRFHNFEKVIKHKGDYPAVSTIKKYMRLAKPKDCVSSTLIDREDGLRLYIENNSVIAYCWVKGWI